MMKNDADAIWLHSGSHATKTIKNNKQDNILWHIDSS